MILQNTTSSASANGSAIARYFIAQHMRDVFRREPRNIGVFVEKSDFIVSRFLGENRETGKFDGRSLSPSVVSSPKAYRVWVSHWKKAVEKSGPEALNRIMLEGAPEFTIIFGGEVTETGSDSPADICEYLYSLLVSHGGLSEALGSQEADESTGELRAEIVSDLRNLGLMYSNPQSWVRHPVLADQQLRGARYWHPISMYQESTEECWAMEPINFTTPRKRTATERAGYLSHIFDDLLLRDRSEGKRVNTVAIVRARPEDLSNKLVDYSLSMLRDTGTNVVDYFDQDSRKKFLSERESVAALP